MDVNNIAGLASQVAQQKTGDAVGVSVLKKALDSQAAAAAQLINALPPLQKLPSNLGNNINTTA